MSHEDVVLLVVVPALAGIIAFGVTFGLLKLRRRLREPQVTVSIERVVFSRPDSRER